MLVPAVLPPVAITAVKVPDEEVVRTGTPATVPPAKALEDEDEVAGI